MRTSVGGRERIYLDHNATTPIDPRVREAMAPHMGDLFGNPSSRDTVDGRAAGEAVEWARAQVAAAIGAQAHEIVFTGSCTEADNMAVLGVARAQPDKRHIVTTRVEHPAVLEPARALEREGWYVTYLDVDETGVVSANDVAAAITDDTALVSVMGANNEVGALQPLKAIGDVCAARDVYFHSDLAQLVAYGDIDVERDGIHLASLSAHKAYGPKGIGALYLRSRKPRVKIAPLLFGGGQERGLRPGTLGTTLIVGMGEAFEIARAERRKDAARLRGLCDRFRDRLLAAMPDARLNGPKDDRLANNLSFSIPGVEPLALMSQLRDVVTFSASSACASGKVETSYVLKAMFGDVAQARQAFRIAPGRFTTEADVQEAVVMFADAAVILRDISDTAQEFLPQRGVAGDVLSCQPD